MYLRTLMGSTTPRTHAPNCCLNLCYRKLCALSGVILKKQAEDCAQELFVYLSSRGWDYRASIFYRHLVHHDVTCGYIRTRQFFKVLLLTFQRGPYDSKFTPPASNALTLWLQNWDLKILTTKWVQLDFPEGTQTFTVLLQCHSEFS